MNQLVNRRVSHLGLDAASELQDDHFLAEPGSSLATEAVLLFDKCQRFAVISKGIVTACNILGVERNGSLRKGLLMSVLCPRLFLKTVEEAFEMEGIRSFVALSGKDGSSQNLEFSSCIWTLCLFVRNDLAVWMTVSRLIRERLLAIASQKGRGAFPV